MKLTVSKVTDNGKKPATVRRYLATIALAHRVAKLENSLVGEAVQLELKGLTNVVSARQKQAHPLGWADIKKYLKGEGKSLRETRDAALLCVAYDTMARRSELVALEHGDIEFLPDGPGEHSFGVRRSTRPVRGIRRTSHGKQSATYTIGYAKPLCRTGLSSGA